MINFGVKAAVTNHVRKKSFLSPSACSWLVFTPQDVVTPVGHYVDSIDRIVLFRLVDVLYCIVLCLFDCITSCFILICQVTASH